MLKASNIQLT